MSERDALDAFLRTPPPRGKTQKEEAHSLGVGRSWDSSTADSRHDRLLGLDSAIAGVATGDVGRSCFIRCFPAFPASVKQEKSRLDQYLHILRRPSIPIHLDLAIASSLTAEFAPDRQTLHRLRIRITDPFLAPLALDAPEIVEPHRAKHRSNSISE